jgi:hypothetical protein
MAPAEARSPLEPGRHFPRNRGLTGEPVLQHFPLCHYEPVGRIPAGANAHAPVRRSGMAAAMGFASRCGRGEVGLKD